MAPTSDSGERCPLIQDDHKRQQPNSITEQRSRRTKYLVVLCILFVELCERLTFYGLSANLVFYCKNVLKLASPISSTIALVFQGTSFFSPLIGGWLADTKIGRFNTIYGSSLLYVLGTILLTAITYNYPNAYALSMSSKEAFLALSLILIAIGTGGIKPNVSPLGADQIKDEGPEMMQRFFNWFFWFILFGALLAFSLVVYVQQEVSFFYGYLIPMASMVLATILLLIGKKHYIVQPPEDSYLTGTLHIIGRGLRDKFCCKKSPALSHWLDGTKSTNGGEYSDEMVEGVKSVARLIPIFVTFILYWTILGQVLTTYVFQGSYMNLKVTDKHSLPASSLTCVYIIPMMVIIPVLDRVVYPGLRRRLGFNVTPLRRIGAGFLFAAGSAVMAGIIEIKRKHIIQTHGTITQNVFSKSVNASTMSVFYQIPQYVLSGTSEPLATVTALEFAYTQSPAELRSVVMGLNLAMTGFGFYVASALVSIVKQASDGQWYPDNFNKGSLEYYMFLLAGLMMVNVVVFLLLAMKYQYADHDHKLPESHLKDCSDREERGENGDNSDR